MSKKPGKYIIGLTGNIATGKSAVRRMLEQLGAYSIDADSLGHRAIARGSPGFQPVLNLFGRWVLGPDGEIDRRRMGRIVFNDPTALHQLETIVHPIVHQGAQWLISNTSQPVIVIEAIKLMESSIVEFCDTVWVVDSPPDLRIQRLISDRGMTEQEARLRVAAQPPQEEKLAKADLVITNAASLEETRQQVQRAWEELNLADLSSAEPEQLPSMEALQVRRIVPSDVLQTDWLSAEQKTRMAHGVAILAAEREGSLQGVLSWYAQDLIARVNCLNLASGAQGASVLSALLSDLERFARELHCEVILCGFAPQRLPAAVWQRLGYQPQDADQLNPLVWREAARPLILEGEQLYMKQLLPERVLRPV